MISAFVLAGAGVLLWLATVLVLLRVMRRSPVLIVIGAAALVCVVLLVASVGDLSKIAGHAMPEQELLARYIEEDSFSRRVAILLEQGHVERTADGLRFSHKGRRIAAAILLLQRAFAIPASG
jgi:hypothetical protein